MDTVNTHGEDIRSPSVLSKESEIDINLPPDPDPTAEAPNTDGDDALSEEESFMTLTQAEKLAWDEMIKTLESELKKRGEDFSQWSDKITRRRMYAYSRMKKLEKSNQTRTEFYGNIDDFIQTFHGDVLKSDEGKLLEGDNVIPKSETQIQTVIDELIDKDTKENTFVQNEVHVKSVTDTPIIKEIPTV